jgi:tRNA(Ile)-lysidine synthase
LHQHRATIEAACRARDIAWREDTTNLSPEFTRGKIRSAVLPTLRAQLNPNVADAILRLAEQARWVGDYLDDAAVRTFDSLVIVEEPQRVVLNNHALLSKQRIVQAEVVRRTITQIVGGEKDLSYAHIEGVLRLACEKASGKELHLPGSLVVRKVYDRLDFRLNSDRDEAVELASVAINCPGSTPLPALNARLVAEVVRVDASTIDAVRAKPDTHEEWLDYERVQLPLIVRGRRAGDRFWPLGAPGSKTLGDFFSDEKIDPALRARTGVLCDQAGPAWVMPLRIDERVKLRPTSRRALRVTLTVHPAPGPVSA